MEFIIRKASGRDAGELVKLRLALQSHLEECDPQVWRLSEMGLAAARPEIESRLKSSNCFFAVAQTAGGETIGMVMAEIVTNIYLEPDIFGHIHWLYVKESARRMGLGRSLVRAATGFFREKGASEITVGFVFRNIEAAGFWDALGFRPNVLHSAAKRDELESILDRD
jgi:ribosomal protein S18 acetylase RimI-like enzyme